MSEETGVDAAEGLTPAAEATETEPTSEDAAESTEEPTSPEAETEAEDDEDPEEWKYLIKKHEHIKDLKARKAAIAKSIIESNNSASRVAKENAALKARLAEFEQGITPKPEKRVEPEPAPPDIQKLEARTKALEAEKAELPKMETQLLSALSEQDGEIAVLQYKLKTVLEEERPAVQAELRVAKADRNTILSRYHSVVGRRADIDEKLEEMGERTKLAHSRLDAEKARQAQAETERASFARDFPQEIDGLITKYMDVLKVPTDKDLRHDLWETVNESLMVAYLRMQGGDPYEVDTPALVRAHVERYAKRMDLIGRAKFKQFSKDKADVAARLSPTIKPSTPREAPRSTAKTEEEIQAELDARLTAARRSFIGRR